MKIDHVQIAIPAGGEDIARVFYGTLLGMAEEEKPAALRPRGGCWFRKGGAVVHLGVDTPFEPQRKAHPAFLVEDLAALASRLEAAGHAVTWDDVVPGRPRFYTADPFGNRIEFIQVGVGFSQ